MSGEGSTAPDDVAELAALYRAEVAASGELQVQACEACGEGQFPPRMRCAACGADALGWRSAGRTGELTALVVVRDDQPRHRRPRRFREIAPYGTGVVAPDDWPDVRVPVLLLGDDVGGEAADALGPVTISIDDVGGTPTPVARRAPQTPPGGAPAPGGTAR